MDVEDKVGEWMKYDKNEQTRNEISSLLESGDRISLQYLLGKRMSFGTAGLRAPMGAGLNKINDLTVIQTTQGLAEYLIQSFEKVELLKRGVVVGYDIRHNSERFAKLVVSVLLGKSIPVLFFSHYVPTPYVAFCVKKMKTIAGVMITASHNPKNDNGYKVYWENGSQILTPHDVGISDAILENQEPWPWSWDIEAIKESHLVIDPYETIMYEYNKALLSLSSPLITNRNCPENVVYTSMHGVGKIFVEKAMEIFSFSPLILVNEQCEPDPEFPTVIFPNPEEGKSSLTLAIKTANENGSPLILANDPDADRLACAEQLKNESWYIFNGNELGALFGWWALKNYIYTQKRSSDKKVTNVSKVFMISSAVSSKILKTMAIKEGFNFEETLTGFKWMGNRYCELTEKGYDVIFIYEEAIGFMYGSVVIDKDGISGAVILREMASWIYSLHSTLNDQLDDIYRQYGYHLSYTSYYLCYKPNIILEIFNNIRKEGNYPNKCGEIDIINIRDATVGYDSSQGNIRCVLPITPKSQLITFSLNNGCTITLRTSGTEPKIKYYGEIINHQLDINEINKSLLLNELHNSINLIVNTFLTPTKYELIPQIFD